MTEPGTEPVAGVVLHGSHVGRSTERIGYTLGSALVVTAERDADMAMSRIELLAP